MNEASNVSPRAAASVAGPAVAALLAGLAAAVAGCPGPTPQHGAPGTGGGVSSSSTSSTSTSASSTSSSGSGIGGAGGAGGGIMTSSSSSGGGMGGTGGGVMTSSSGTGGMQCTTDADCPPANPPCTNDGFYTGATCSAGMCVPNVAIDCKATQKVCKQNGCVHCLADADCAAESPADCSHNTCSNGLCVFTPQGTTCTSQANTCDGDGNCIQGKYVFVTAKVFGSTFGGTAQADLACATAASNAKLGGTWISWTSDGDATSPPALMRLMPTPQQRYLLLDGTIVIPGWGSAANTMIVLTNGIDKDETKAALTGLVWTGTSPTGSYSGFSCNNWMGGLPVLTGGTVGTVGQTDASWTAAPIPAQCDGTMAHLYCFLK